MNVNTLKHYLLSSTSEMKEDKRGFTLIELIVTITIYMSLFIWAFYLVWIITQHVERNKTIIDLNRFILQDKEFSDITRKNVAFYSYEDLVTNKQTGYWFEDGFRKDIKELINNTMKAKIASSYDLSSPSVCYSLVNDLMTHEESKYIDEYKLNACSNNYASPEFKENYNILTLVDRENLDVTVYFIYRYNLFRIKSKLNKDLTKDEIVFRDPNTSTFIEVENLRKDLIFQRFKGSAGNACGGADCIFETFSGKNNNIAGIVDMKMIKIKEGEDGRYDFNSSFVVEILRNLNIQQYE